MGRSFGTAISSIASVVLVLMLLAAFVPESFRDVMLYYNFDTVSPLLAGVLAILVVAVFAAVRSGRLSEPLGTGIALGLGLVIAPVVTVWALTGRVDVFLAPSWAFPVHRWALVVVSVLVVLGAALRAWDLGLLWSGR